MLTPEDLAMFARLGIDEPLLTAAGVQRVTTEEARQRGIVRRARADLSGLYFPYRDPVSGQELPGRLRRDNPEVDTKGRPIAKYLCPIGADRHLYFPPGADGLLKDVSVPLIFVEAEKSALAITAAAPRHGVKLLAVAMGGCYGWHGRAGTHTNEHGVQVEVKGPLPSFELVAWNGRAVFLCFDANVATNPNVQRARRLLTKELEGRGAKVRLVNLPPGDGVNGPDDYLATRGAPAFFQLLEQSSEPSQKRRGGGAHLRAYHVLRAQEGTQIFRTPFGEGYVRSRINGHQEVHATRSTRFQQLLSSLYFHETKDALNRTALQDAVALVEAEAINGTLERDVFLRVARVGGVVYVDLADPAWRVIEISASGHRVLDQSPVAFRRARGMLPLPAPEPGGSLDEIRSLLNLPDEEAAVLVFGWVVAALRGKGPYPVLVFNGEQGSTKSTVTKLTRGLIDPNTMLTRAEPRDARDLAVAAQGNYVVALENLSGLSGRLSDRICRLATGGGFATRQLYTDDDERVFDDQRPVILNGIEDLATRGDLLDRSLVITLPRVLPERRRTEEELLAEFDRVRRRTIGLLMTAVSKALADYQRIKIARLPRMADPTIWVTAAEGVLGFAYGSFLRAQRHAAERSDEVALEASPVGEAIRTLVRVGETWEGTATELLERLSDGADDRRSRPRGWPRTAAALGGMVRRLAPSLRGVGVFVDLTRDGHDRRRIITIRNVGPEAVRTVRIEDEPATTASAADGEADGADGEGVCEGGASSAGAAGEPCSQGSTGPSADAADGPSTADAPPEVERPPESVSGYRVCESVADLRRFLDAAARDAVVAADWETTSLNLHDSRFGPVGLALATGPGEALYVPLGHDDTASNLDLEQVGRVLASVGDRLAFIFYNSVFDLSVSEQVVGWVPRRWDDAMLGVQLADPAKKRVGLKETVSRLFGVAMTTYDELTRGGPFSRLSPEAACQYTCSDADFTLRVWKEPHVQDAVSQQRDIYDLEHAFVGVLRQARQHQLFLDGPRLADVAVQLRRDLGHRRQRLGELAGRPLNPNSTSEVTAVLKELGLTTGRLTPGGSPSTAWRALAASGEKHPFLEELIGYRQRASLLRTYVERLLEARERWGDGMRFSFRAIGAPTGRMSSGGGGQGARAYEQGAVPINVQAVPSGDVCDGVKLRTLFCANPVGAAPEFHLVAVDYSQMELRIAANLSGEPAWIKTFADPQGDIHLTNARLALGKPGLTGDDKAERAKGKTISFAILYGSGPQRIAEQAGISTEVAEALIRRFRRETPVLHRWIDTVRRDATAAGFVRTAFGRVRPLPALDRGSRADRAAQQAALREAVNTVVQGTAADVFKLACCRLHAEITRRGWQDACQLVLFVHDELVLRVRTDRLDEIVPVILAQLTFTKQDWAVPLVVEAEFGSTWGELRPFRSVHVESVHMREGAL